MLYELPRAAYRHLLNSTAVRTLIADGFIGRDVDQFGVANGPYSEGWVFRSKLDGIPYRDVEGSGKAAISVYTYDSWGGSTMYHSNKFPRLHVAIYADVSRDASLPVKYTAEENVMRIYEAIDPLFHDSANRIHKFDDLHVVSTVAGGGFSFGAVPGGDGVVRGDAVYDVTLL